MPIIKQKPLEGLKGLSEQEREEFKAKQIASGRLAEGSPDEYFDALYRNGQFIDRFGMDAFKNTKLEDRTALLNHALIGEAWDSQYKDMPIDWKQKYNALPDEYRLKVLDSDYLTPEEQKKQWAEEDKQYEKRLKKQGIWGQMTSPTLGMPFPEYYQRESTLEPIRQIEKEKNDRILEHIYNDAVDKKAEQLNARVDATHYGKAISSLSDEQVEDWFKKVVVPNSYVDAYGRPNPGIPEFAKFYVENPDDGGEDMRNFSIDDKRKILAMNEVYNNNMDSEMAKTALNNYAMRYNKSRQDGWDKAWRFGKDVLISSSSYTMDKVNSVYNLGLGIADGVSEKPEVFVDDQGNIVDTEKTDILSSPDGKLFYTGEDGKPHYIHKEKVSRTTLHNMGKNLGVFGGLGSEDESILNPQDWTAREAMGVWSKDLAKEYQKIGTSPYKVVYEPNDDRDLMYESFKMVSFGLADGAAQLLPFGIGAAGKVLSTADKLGKVGKAVGSVMNFAGRMLSTESAFGSAAQGLLGAGGIGYAYSRGAFPETLEKNLSGLEESTLNRANEEIQDRYETDEEFRAQVDNATRQRAAQIKQDLIRRYKLSGENATVFEDNLNKQALSEASSQIQNELLSAKVGELKSSDEYGALQQEAIESAGETAWRTFLPEAIKYGIVNTLGYRKWLYTNPSGIKSKVSGALRGLREATTAEGRKRLAVDTKKFLTNGEKLAHLGKTAGSQFWGGSWTNGTDDMMVDAAERINDDSFGRYLNAYENGEAMANTYGLADGLYAYWKGAQNSLGQETTLDAAAVGGFGSLVTVSPNMANIASLFTKEGKEAYRNNFQRKYERDANDNVIRDEHGVPKYKDISWKNNWRDRANFFIMNGVLNSYYESKQNDRTLQNHADYVNMLLDDYDDFKAIEDLVTSDIGVANAEDLSDEKTMRFISAINSVNTLNNLALNEKDPATLSTVVQNAKDFISKAASMQMEGDNAFSEEEINGLLAQYYSHNPGIPQTDANNQLALYSISQNAQKLQEAAEAYDEAEKQIQKIESNKGIRISPSVRAKMKLDQALNAHWIDRRGKMRDEIDDTSNVDGEVSMENLIPSVGGVKNAEKLIQVYDKQHTEYQKALEEQQKETKKLQEAYDKTLETQKNATTSESKYKADENVRKAKAELDNALQQESYLNGLIARTDEKKVKVENALKAASEEGSDIAKKVLTADEIFSLDPITRARVMRPETRSLYSKAQQKEIEKLEQRLLMRDADALSKIQDIAKLTQRINQNQDAYNRMAQNPEAAAIQMDIIRGAEADAATKLINKRNAQTIADYINSFDAATEGHDDVIKGVREEFAFRTMRKFNPTLLNIIKEDKLLPQYENQIANALEWGKALADISAIISESEKSDDWKTAAYNAVDAIIENAHNKNEIMSLLEQAVDNHPQAEDIEKILSDLTKMDYQRDSTIVEKRKDRKEREEAARKKAEEDKKKAEAAAKEAAKKQAEEKAKKATEQAQRKDDSFEVEEEVTLDLGEEKPTETPATPVTEGEVQKGINQEPLGVLLSWVKGEISKEDAIKLLDGTEYVKHIEGNKALHTGDGVYLTDVDGPVERLLGKYITDKYPFLTVETVKQATGVSTFGDMTLIVVKDTEGKEYGAPSNFLKNLYREKNGVAATLIASYESAQQNGDSSVINNVKEGHDDRIGDYVEGQSLSAVEEAQQLEGQGEVVEVTTDVPTDVDTIADTAEDKVASDTTTLSGNAMPEWVINKEKENAKNERLGLSVRYDKDLSTDHVLEHKRGDKPNDDMNNFFSWMENAGIKYQNIIDDELSVILANNPQTKIKFMRVRPTSNATHDEYLKNTLLLVVDYDNNINKGITSIHNEDNGGVVDSAGKKYLIVGVLGFGNSGINSDRGKLWQTLNTQGFKGGHELPVKAWTWFNQKGHEAERFYVHDGFATEEVLNTITPGWIVRGERKKISDLLSDKSKNPHGLTMGTLGWSIIEYSQPVDINVRGKKVIHPQNRDTNSGRVFVLIPAGNGQLVSAKVDALFYNDEKFNKESELYQELQQELMKLASPKYEDRYAALLQLMQKLYLTPEGHNILLAKDGNAITFAIGEDKNNTIYTKAPDFSVQQLLDAVTMWNPRINITARVLSNPKELQKYDDAGALMTDLDKLGTAGVNYSVYAIDSNGEMIKPTDATWTPPRAESDSQYRDVNRLDVPYLYGTIYSYNRNTGEYTRDGVPVTDEETIRGLNYARDIIDNDRIPVKTEGVWNYYILSEGERPLVVKQSNQSKKIEEVEIDEAKKIVQAEIDKRQAAAREQAISEELGKVEVEQKDSGEVPLDLGVEEKKEEKRDKPVAPIQPSTPKEGTQTFDQLIRSKNRSEVLNAIKDKMSYDDAWKDAPIKSPAQLTQYLMSKGISLDNIPTDDAGLKAWIHNNIECK